MGYPPEVIGPCKGGCCKTPYGHSTEAPASCRCHTGHENAHKGDLNHSAQGDGWDWRDDAACLNMDVNLFFPDDKVRADEPKGICAGCEVKMQCLTYAMAHERDWGIFGGLSVRERRELTKGTKKEREFELPRSAPKLPRSRHVGD